MIWFGKNFIKFYMGFIKFNKTLVHRHAARPRLDALLHHYYIIIILS